ncbi:MAG: DUF58 domain-containing protein [Treponema sp.]|nr:DUF58 domain-containing protein [Treponema sp.]
MRPGRGLFAAALGFLLLGMAAFFSERIFLIWFFAACIILPLAAIDALILLFFTGRLETERHIPASLAQDEPVRVQVTIRRNSRLPVPAKILLYDLYPPSMSCGEGRESFPRRLDRKVLTQGGSIILEYTLLPRERGPWFFRGLDLLLSSPLHFWRLRVFHETGSRGRTYPDFKKLSSGEELRGIAGQRGSREIRRRGQGLEFLGLRDFLDGDSLRAIDWRASSRNRQLDGRLKLIVREYQDEQDQQVLFALDSGYRLLGPQFDSALNALLLLSRVALKHGDSVAAQSFGASERWIPPRKGNSAMTGLLRGFYDLQSAPVPSSPFSALENALVRLHRRTFIILVSNFREEDGESLSWILPRIKRRHLLLLVSFQEEDAEALAARKPGADHLLMPGETLETAAAFSYLSARRRLYRQWEHLGLLTLETTPSHISPALINRYLSVKRSGKL